MAQDRTNPLANMSYTNKDFEAIYPELLDLVKVLTSKWDPSISNESDPGVVLLKLNALIADKLNYNVDKNVLECFPLSVTQEQNARRLYAQLGYYMKWYQSATTNVSIKWTSDTSNTEYTIPAFTMVSDANNTIVYTLVGPKSSTDSNEDFNVGDQKLGCDGTITTFKAIQGVAVNYEINGSKLITVANLDENNRLYFNTTDIAQNGIFITNANLNNYSSWSRKDNLLLEDQGSLIYRFGVSDDGTECYIEFPEDADTIFKEGINITYISTVGVNGNLAASAIEKFYSDLVPAEDDTIVLNADNVKIQNPSAAKNGLDPETIEDAYSNYKKTIGTFKTLVTLRDFFNAICTSGLVSNCIISDRTNDPQCVYKIASSSGDIDTVTTQVEVIDDEPTLTAFSLKMYLLQYKDVVDDFDSFDTTFTPIGTSATTAIKAYIQDNKSIQHDYVDIIPTTSESSHFCFFKNKYPINCRLTTQYQLTTAEANELISNVKVALCNELNSKEIEFGDEIDTDIVYEAIEKSDSRIKNVSLDAINYTTYAVYYDGSSFNEVNISDDIEESGKYSYSTTSSVSSFNDNLKMSFDDYNKFIYLLWTIDTADPESGMPIDVYTLFTQNSLKFKPSGTSKTKTATVGSATITIPSTAVSVEDYFGINIKGVDTSTEPNDAIVEITQDDIFTLQHQFRQEIYTKSALSGITQLFVKDETFDYRLNQGYNSIISLDNNDTTKIVSDIEKIEGEFSKTFNADNTEYTLRTNENIQFFAPSLITDSTYSNYVKYEYYIKELVSAGSDYQLKTDEYIILYWKEDDLEGTIYKYYTYGQGNIICPSFEMQAKSSQSDIIGKELAVKGTTLRNIGTDEDPQWVGDSGYNGDMRATISEQISELTSSTNILSGSKQVVTKKINKVIIDDTDYYCYWITDTVKDDKYVLFEAATSTTDPEESSYTKILSSGEYFIYSNSTLSDLIILGAGTEITRKTNTGQKYSSDTWAVEKIDSENILEDGASALSDVWFKIPSGLVVDTIENQFVNVGAGASVKITTDDTSLWPLTITKTQSEDLNGYTLMYKSASDTAYTKLNDIDLSSHGSWKARTMLSIVMNSVNEQVLLAGHSLYYYLKDDTTRHGPIEGGDLVTGSSPYYPTVLLASHDISNSTGDLADVYYYDDYGNMKYIALYNFKKYVDSDTVNYSSSGAAILTFEGSSTGATETKSFNFSLPVGNYILPVTNSREKLTDLKVYLDGTALGKMYDTSSKSLRSMGTHYLYMPITEIKSHQLTVEMSGHKSEVVFTLTNPYRYNKPDSLEDYEFEQIKTLLGEFDSGHNFNYVHEVSSDDEISNPLLGNSFNSPNHPFNKFTICQMDTSSNSSIYVLGKK